VTPKRRSIAIAVGVIVAAWMIAGIVLAGRNEVPLPSSSQPIVLKNGRVSGNHISTRSWTFAYNRAQWSSDGVDATIYGVHDGILYKRGKPYLTIAAQNVHLNTQTLDFTAVGDVHVAAVHPNDRIGKSFDSDLVIWSNATKTLTLPHASIFRTGDQVLKVASAEAHFDTDVVQLGKIEGAVEAPGP
jgi:hypothetical protein